MVISENKPTNLIDVLRFWAETSPNKIAYTFLADGGNKQIDLTYRQLDQDAKAIA